MKYQKKINSSDEININEIIIKIIDNKKIIYFTTLLSVIFFFIHILLKTPDELYNSNTIIQTISKNQAQSYDEFNEYVDFANSLTLIFNQKDKIGYKFSKVNKEILFKLFTEKLKDKDYLVESINKFELIKKENFKNNQKYENAVNNLLSQIEIKIEDYDNNLETVKKVNIIFKTSNKLQLENFIKYIEKDINLKIQKILNERFKEEVKRHEKIKKLILEEINNQLELDLSQEYLAQLENKKKLILNQKHLTIIKNLFDLTPIVNSGDFSSVQIFKPKFDNNITLLPSLKLFIFTCLFGVILGSLYILIFEEIRKVYNLLVKKK